MTGVARGQENLHWAAFLLDSLSCAQAMFQSKYPRVHELHDDQERLIMWILSCFIKPEYLTDSKGNNLSGPKMNLLSLKSQESYLSKAFVGFEASAILDQTDWLWPRLTVIQAYVSCAGDLQVKLPLSGHFAWIQMHGEVIRFFLASKGYQTASI